MPSPKENTAPGKEESLNECFWVQKRSFLKVLIELFLLPYSRSRVDNFVDLDAPLIFYVKYLGEHTTQKTRKF